MVLALLTAWQESVSEWIDPDLPAGYEIHFSQLLVVTEARFFSFALLTPIVLYAVRRLLARRTKPLRAVAVYLIGAVPFVLLYACIRLVVAPIWSLRLQRFLPRSPQHFVGTVTGTLGAQISVYVALVIAAHAYEYYERSRNQELERSELEQALAASELQALKSQLHPHFLFNTLHGIVTLIDADRGRAKNMVLQLSNLLRTALQHGTSDLVSLQDELKFIDAYLRLEKMRLSHRLDVRWNVASDTSALLVPQMILQPLVENAIVHGIACCREGGWLEISARRDDGRVELKIQNSVCGKRRAGMGLGLKNARARLKYLYSDEATLSFAVAESRLATVTLLLPVLPSHQAYSARNASLPIHK